MSKGPGTFQTRIAKLQRKVTSREWAVAQRLAETLPWEVVHLIYLVACDRRREEANARRIARAQRVTEGLPAKEDTMPQRDKPTIAWPDDYAVQISVTASPVDDPFATEIEFDILKFMDEEGIESIEVGGGKAGYLHLQAWINQSKYGLLNIFDMQGVEYLDFAEALFDPGNEREFKKAVQDEYTGTLFSDVLVLEELRVDPEHRGHNVGLMAAAHLIKTFAWAHAVTAILPFPIDLSHDEQQDKGRVEAASAKLRAHFAKIGFEEVGEGVMVLKPLDLVI